MKTEGNTILVTGGATGIGFSLSEHFVKEGNEVIICGRRRERLDEAKNKLPRIHTRQCDLSKDKERKALHEWVVSNFKDINVLVNNAGIQRMIDLRKGTQDLFDGDDEIETNLKACVHMSAYFIPDFLKKKESAIIDVSSGLAFIPMAFAPVYCATKAAVHSFTVTLRHQLRSTPIKVFEIIPPAVESELGTHGKGGKRHQGIPPSEVSEAVMKALEKDEFEIAVGQAQGLRATAVSSNFDQSFQNMNRW
jgi:uncharacterized oxidoreductase